MTIAGNVFNHVNLSSMCVYCFFTELGNVNTAVFYRLLYYVCYPPWNSYWTIAEYLISAEKYWGEIKEEENALLHYENSAHYPFIAKLKKKKRDKNLTSELHITTIGKCKHLIIVLLLL